MEALIKSVFAAVGATLAWFFGGFDVVFYALVAFATVDYISGVIAAYIKKQLDSSTGFKGILKKVAMFLVVGIAAVIDRVALGSSGVLRSAIICYYIANEGLSLLENAGKMGLPIPEKLKRALTQLFDEEDDGQ